MPAQKHPATKVAAMIEAVLAERHDIVNQSHIARILGTTPQYLSRMKAEGAAPVYMVAMEGMRRGAHTSEDVR